MRVGSTPTHTFTFPFLARECQEIKITYSQGCKVILEKHIDDLTLSGNTAQVTLTQDETFRFDECKPINIQARVLRNGYALTSDITQVSVYRCLDDEILEVQEDETST